MTTAFIGGTGLSLIWPYEKVVDLGLGPTTFGHQSRAQIGKGLINVRGRIHAYETGSTAAMAPVYAWLVEQGIERVIISGAVGSMDASLPPGQLVEIQDHLFFGGASPLVGQANAFIDMSQAYGRGWSGLPRATYAWTHGPHLETPAEIRALKSFGGQVVGMSIPPEVILAKHHGMQVYALACVVNWAAGQGAASSIDAMLEIGRQASKALPDLVRCAMKAL